MLRIDRTVTNASPPADRATREPTRPKDREGDHVILDAVFHVPEIHPTAPGPWSHEADKLAWTDAATGYACIVRRSPRGGRLCGYIAVPPGHPLYGTPVQALVGLHVTVHNGLSYAEECERHDPASLSVCHPGPDRPDEVDGEMVHRVEATGDGHDNLWWFGFECDGAADVTPNVADARAQAELHAGIVERAYRDEAFLLEEVTRLAVQLKAVELGLDPVEVVVPRRLERDVSCGDLA